MDSATTLDDFPTLLDSPGAEPLRALGWMMRPFRPGGIGRRILVWGPSGSGKTTLSRRIGEAIGLPVIELDSMFHRPNWEPTPEDEFVSSVLHRVQGYHEGWVVDGNYGAVRGRLLPLADTVVRLRLPFHAVYRRLLGRTVTRAWRRQELWNGNRESFGLAFLSRDSILLWGITHWRAHHRHVNQALREVPHSAEIRELRSRDEVEQFVASLTEVG